MVPLKYSSNFCRNLENLLIDCQINLDLNWSKDCVIVATEVVDQEGTFSITKAKLFFPVVTLSSQDNVKTAGTIKM